MRLSIIVAMSRNRVIGRDGGMPWHLPEDLKRFKALTMGKPIIMGRKTFESLGRILPGRRHIVISRRQDYQTHGAEVVASLDAALAAAERAEADEVFVIGGSEIFRAALPRADRLYMTLIDADIEGDAHFPGYNENEWREVAREERSADEKNNYGLMFKELENRNKTYCPDARPEFLMVNRYLGWGDRGKDRHRKNRHEGGLWFIGMEEATNILDKTRDEIGAEYTDLGGWKEELSPCEWTAGKGDPVRLFTSKIVCFGNGKPLSRIVQQKGSTAKDYRDQHLWRKGSQICQANVLPIGKQKGRKRLPSDLQELIGYSDSPEDWNKYVRCVKHTRILCLHRRWKEYGPQAVVCFGKTYWEYHRWIFPLDEATKSIEDNGNIEIYENEKVLLVPFLGNGQMSDKRAQCISRILSGWDVSIP